MPELKMSYSGDVPNPPNTAQFSFQRCHQETFYLQNFSLFPCPVMDGWRAQAGKSFIALSLFLLGKKDYFSAKGVV
jgi:hypothetical protein